MKKVKWIYYILVGIVNLASVYYIFTVNQVQVDLAIAAEPPTCLIGPIDLHPVYMQTTLHALTLSIGLLVFTYQLSKAFNRLLEYQRKKFILISTISGCLPLLFIGICWIDLYCH